MADTVWGVKVTEELKEEIQELVTESGLQNKDFLKQVINTYKIEKQKDKTPAIKEDFNALQELTAKINDLYIAMANRIEINTASMQDEFEKESRKNQNKIERLEKEEDDLKEELDELKKIHDENVNLLNVLKDEVNQVNKVNLEKQENIELLKENLRSAKDQLNIYVVHETEYQNLTAEKKQLENELEKANFYNQQLESSLNDLKTSTNKKIEEMEKQVTMERRSLDLLKQAELLDLKKKHQEELEQQAKKHREEIAILNQIIKNNMEEFQAYIKENSQKKEDIK